MGYPGGRTPGQQAYEPETPEAVSTTIHPETILGPIPDLVERARNKSGYPETEIDRRAHYACGWMGGEGRDLLIAMESAMRALDSNDSEGAYDTLYRASLAVRGEIPNPKYREPEPDRYKEAREREDLEG